MANLVVVYDGSDGNFRQALVTALGGLAEVVDTRNPKMQDAHLALVDQGVETLEKALSDYQVAGIPTVLVANGPGPVLEGLCDSGLTSGFVTRNGGDKLLAMGLWMIMADLGIEVPAAEE